MELGVEAAATNPKRKAAGDDAATATSNDSSCDPETEPRIRALAKYLVKQGGDEGLVSGWRSVEEVGGAPLFRRHAPARLPSFLKPMTPTRSLAWHACRRWAGGALAAQLTRLCLPTCTCRRTTKTRRQLEIQREQFMFLSLLKKSASSRGRRLRGTSASPLTRRKRLPRQMARRLRPPASIR